MTTEAERLKVLEMLSSGTINAEEAALLLEALGEDSGAPTAAPFAAAPPAPPAPRVRAAPLDMSVNELVSASLHGVTPEYVREIRWVFASATVNEIIAAAIHGVTPEFVRELREAGFPGITLNDAVSCRIHGVTSEYVAEMSGFFGREVQLQELLTAAATGFDLSTADELRAAFRE